MTESTSEKILGPDISREIFGGVLDYDGAGRYPGLELMNLVYCSDDSPLPSGEKVSVSRRGHDFARRLVWDKEFHDHPKKDDVLYDENSELAIRHLLRCIQLPIPSTSKTPGWDRAHFFPYTKSLIHWDARIRGKNLQIQRRYLRGGGALAFRVLRMDKNTVRRDQIRDGFESLYSGENTGPLETLASVLLGHGGADPTPLTDEIEAASRVLDDRYDELLRDGVANILNHLDLPTVARIRALMNWVGFWLVVLQHSRASISLDREPGVIICDCGAGHAQLRRESQRCLARLQSLILEAVDEAAKGKDLKQKQRDKIRSFFWATAATIGLLNSWRGRRHFTLGIEALEMHVLAATAPSTEISFESFTTDWLFERCGIVVGREAAERSGLLMDFDASIFEENESQLALQMQAAGLLSVYSDATRMVGAGQERL